MIDIIHIDPNPDLSKYIRKISVFKSKKIIQYKQKLMPSAFTYLSYNFKDIPASYFNNRRIQPKSRLQIAGPKINDDIYVEYDGSLCQILIEFTASGFYYLFHISPSRFTNNLSDLGDLISSQLKTLLDEELIMSDNGEQQIEVLEDFLRERIPKALPFNDYIEKALNIIEKYNGSFQINELIKDIGIGERQFDRKFREIVGITPKCYSKIFQLHYVINLMHSKKYSSVQELAFQAEFYDLAHFTNRFKELTGFTPNEFIKSDKHIALKYFTDLIK